MTATASFDKYLITKAEAKKVWDGLRHTTRYFVEATRLYNFKGMIFEFHLKVSFGVPPTESEIRSRLDGQYDEKVRMMAFPLFQDKEIDAK